MSQNQGYYGQIVSLLALVALNGCLTEKHDKGSAEQQGCTSCHGGLLADPFSAAPPFNLNGDTEPSRRGNGAHKGHLLGGGRARPLACSECHHVPTETFEAGHVDTPYPSEVLFDGPAKAFRAEPSYNFKTSSCENTFCHGGYFVGGRPSGGTEPSPRWTDVSPHPLSCHSCHGMPPPAPHPEVENCNECHHNVQEDHSFSRPLLHVDGVVTFFLPNDD